MLVAQQQQALEKQQQLLQQQAMEKGSKVGPDGGPGGRSVSFPTADTAVTGQRRHLSLQSQPSTSSMRPKVHRGTR